MTQEQGPSNSSMRPGTHPSISRRSALLLLGAGACKLNAQTTAIAKIDLFPAFFQFWKETNDASPDAHARRFLELVVQPHADLFDGFTDTVSVERAARYLARVEPLVPVIESLHTWVAKEFDRKVADFQKELPDFHWRGSVVFMPNLFGFDAGTGSIAGKDFLVFGLDTIAQMDGPHADLSVLIAHELFHIYHASFHPEWEGQSRGKDIPLYRLIWGKACLLTRVSNSTRRRICPQSCGPLRLPRPVRSV